MGRLTGKNKKLFKIVPVNLKLGLAEDYEDYVEDIQKKLTAGRANNNAVTRELIRIAINDEDLKLRIINAIEVRALYS